MYSPLFCIFIYVFTNNKLGEDMKVLKNISIKTVLSGISVGIINGLLGAGGGMIAVPLLKNLGFSQSKAQANAVAVILPISLISAAIYVLRGNVSIADSLIYIPGGIIGTLIGTFILCRIPQKILKKIFAAFMIWAGIRLLTR